MRGKPYRPYQGRRWGEMLLWVGVLVLAASAVTFLAAPFSIRKFADEPTTEAAAMRDYLVEHGVEESRILLEEASHNTWQNINNTFALLKEKGYGERMGQVLVVTNGFHLARVRILWARVWEGTYTLSTLAAPESHMGARVQSYLREAPALVKSWLLDRN